MALYNAEQTHSDVVGIDVVWTRNIWICFPDFNPSCVNWKDKVKLSLMHNKSSTGSSYHHLTFFPPNIMSIDRLCPIKAKSSCSAEASVLSGVCLCHSFHRKLERQEMAAGCKTYRGGYSCICFYSCFLAFGLLSGDTAVCTPAAEVPDNWQQKTKGEWQENETFLWERVSSKGIATKMQ